MQRIVVIADTHTGHKVGLNPDPVDNPFSKWVKETWSTFCKEYHNPEFIMMVGDFVDGPGNIRLGVEQVTTSLTEQIKWNKILLDELKGPDTEIMGTDGSDYHKGARHAVNADQTIIEDLGGDFSPSILEFSINNKLIQASHGGSYSIRNRFNYIKREMDFALRNAHKREGKCPNILIRAHEHEYAMASQMGISAVIVPCWQYLTPYMTKKTGNALPDIGALIIEGPEPIKVYPVIYPIPESINEKMRRYKSDIIKARDEKRKKDRVLFEETLKEKSKVM